MGQCSKHGTTLLPQDFQICSKPEEERQVRNLLAASTDKVHVGRTNLVNQPFSADPGTRPIGVPFNRLDPIKDRNVEERVRFNRV